MASEMRRVAGNEDGSWRRFRANSTSSGCPDGEPRHIEPRRPAQGGRGAFPGGRRGNEPGTRGPRGDVFDEVRAEDESLKRKILNHYTRRCYREMGRRGRHHELQIVAQATIAGRPPLRATVLHSAGLAFMEKIQPP